jgi:hypothetical protein
MFVTTQILKRKDAASVVVAVIIAMVVAPMLAALTAKLSGTLSGLSNDEYATYVVPGASFSAQYVQPVVSVVLQLVLLELLVWLYVTVVASMKSSNK